jgi:Phosphatidylethanolamine-binding protein
MKVSTASTIDLIGNVSIGDERTGILKGEAKSLAASDNPSTANELAEDAARSTKLKRSVNDFRGARYGGPCPLYEHGSHHRPHHYHFRLRAPSMGHLAAQTDTLCRDVERAADKFTLAQATFIDWHTDNCGLEDRSGFPGLLPRPDPDVVGPP